MITNANNCSPRLVIIGDYLFDPGVGLISGPSGAHYVCPHLACILTVLVENAGSVVQHDDLSHKPHGCHVEDAAALARQIARLKRYLRDTGHPPNYIESVPNKGYRLVAPVYGSTESPEPILAPAADKPRARPGGFSRLINEFRDRKVCRSMLIYSAVVWLTFEITDLVVPALGLPEWVLTLVVYLGILGFPIAAMLAWVFDLTPEGIIRDPRTPQPRPGTRRKKTEMAVDFALIAAAVAICSLLVFSSHSGGTPEAQADVDGKPPPEKIYFGGSGNSANGAI